MGPPGQFRSFTQAQDVRVGVDPGREHKWCFGHPWSFAKQWIFGANRLFQKLTNTRHSVTIDWALCLEHHGRFAITLQMQYYGNYLTLKVYMTELWIRSSVFFFFLFCVRMQTVGLWQCVCSNVGTRELQKFVAAGPEWFQEVTIYNRLDFGYSKDWNWNPSDSNKRSDRLRRSENYAWLGYSTSAKRDDS